MLLLLCNSGAGLLEEYGNKQDGLAPLFAWDSDEHPQK
jgi:hypothetical protein